MSSLLRYVGFSHLESLRRGKLHISSYSRFNDEFELHFTSEVQRAMSREEIPSSISPRIARILMAPPNPLIHETLEDFRRNHFPKRFEQLRMICCSRCETDELKVRLQDIRMWTYYGDANKGIKIHLSSEFEHDTRWQVEEMIYNDKPLALDYDTLMGDDKKYSEWAMKVVTRKSNALEFENERRVFISPASIEKCVLSDKTERDCISLSPTHITRIDLGTKFANNFQRGDPAESLADSQDHCLSAILEYFPNISIFQAIACPESYAYRYDFVSIHT